MLCTTRHPHSVTVGDSRYQFCTALTFPSPQASQQQTRRTGHQLLLPETGTRGRGLPWEHTGRAGGLGPPLSTFSNQVASASCPRWHRTKPHNGRWVWDLPRPQPFPQACTAALGFQDTRERELQTSAHPRWTAPHPPAALAQGGSPHPSFLKASGPAAPASSPHSPRRRGHHLGACHSSPWSLGREGKRLKAAGVDLRGADSAESRGPRLLGPHSCS